MKRLLLFTTISISLLTSCSTAYKSGQTPDDVYYSPGRVVVSAKEEEKQQQQLEQYEEYVSTQDDRYLRMKVANRSRWNTLDDYDYWYDSRYDFCRSNYSFYNNYSYYNPWNTGWQMGISYGRGYNYGLGWNSPFYTVVAYGSPKFSIGGYTSGSNISAYRNKSYLNTNNYGSYNSKTGTYKPAANNSNSFGNLLKRVFTTTPSGNTSSHDRPARTFDTKSSNSAPASSSSGGSSGGFKSTGSSSSTGRGGRG
jgi:uncharacterized membrane protein YgcG